MNVNESAYTPTTGEILTAVLTYRAISGGGTPPSIRDNATPDEAATYLAEFNRWMDKVRAEAWDEGAEVVRDIHGDMTEPNPYRKEEQ